LIPETPSSHLRTALLVIWCSDIAKVVSNVKAKNQIKKSSMTRWSVRSGLSRLSKSCMDWQLAPFSHTRVYPHSWRQKS